jgi:hypothetical protein
MAAECASWATQRIATPSLDRRGSARILPLPKMSIIRFSSRLGTFESIAITGFRSSSSSGSCARVPEDRM